MSALEELEQYRESNMGDVAEEPYLAAIAELEATLIKWVDLCYEEQQRAERAEAERDHLKAENENMAALIQSCHDNHVPKFVEDGLRERAEKAEAELAVVQEDHATVMADYITEVERTRAAEAAKSAAITRANLVSDLFLKAEAENARLRVCGTCGHLREHYDGTCCTELAGTALRYPDDFVDIRDPCHFDPPRWTPYWETKPKEDL